MSKAPEQPVETTSEVPAPTGLPPWLAMINPNKLPPGGYFILILVYILVDGGFSMGLASAEDVAKLEEQVAELAELMTDIRIEIAATRGKPGP